MNNKLFVQELKDLLEKHNVFIGVEIDGDTCNLGTDFCVYDKNNDNKITILAECQDYIDSYDLKLFLESL